MAVTNEQNLTEIFAEVNTSYPTVPDRVIKCLSWESNYVSNAIAFSDIDYSFELIKEATYSELTNYYTFKNRNEIVEFLIRHIELVNLLKALQYQTVVLFGTSKFKLELELIVEEQNWKTLFINIYNNLNISQAKDYIDSLLDWMIDGYEDQYPYINITNNLLKD